MSRFHDVISGGPYRRLTTLQMPPTFAAAARAVLAAGLWARHLDGRREMYDPATGRRVEHADAVARLAPHLDPVLWPDDREDAGRVIWFIEGHLMALDWQSIGAGLMVRPIPTLDQARAALATGAPSFISQGG